MTFFDSSRKQIRTIIHMDLDAFFCAVEEIFDPSLHGKPFAVGGTSDGRGVVTSCSYAARKKGVRSAMPMAQAIRLCPDIIAVHRNYSNYREYSKRVMDILRTFSEKIQPISIDEAFLDISHLNIDGPTCAHQIQDAIRDQVGLPSSFGIATNKLMAKIATNTAKAMHTGDSYPNAIMVIEAGREADFLAPLPTDALWGVGPKTADRLRQIGLNTIGDIAAYPIEKLEKTFGQTGKYLHLRSQGIDDSPVHSSHETKSVSHENTFFDPTADESQLLNTLQRQSQSISKRLKKLELSGKTVKIKIRWPDFTTFTRQMSLPEPVQDEKDILDAAQKLFYQYWQKGKKVRLIGVGLSELGLPSRQLSLWKYDKLKQEKQVRLEAALKQIQSKYGENLIHTAGKL